MAMMDINDAKAVIKGLQEKPFICSENAIETNNGFVIKRIPQKYSNADKIRSMNDEELANFLSKTVWEDGANLFDCADCECVFPCTECRMYLDWLQSKAE